MADRTVASTETLDTLRTTYNSTAGDVGDIASLTNASGVIASSTDVIEAITAINTEVNAIKAGTAVFETKITFEGDTADAHETILAITDPTADRTITIPDASGTIVTTTATQTLTNKTLTSPTLTSAVLNTAVSGSAVLDEDDMDSNSATKVATQQSVKAYVDAQITAQDLDVTSDSGTIAIDLNSETLTIAGGTNVTTTGSGNNISIATSTDVVTLTSTSTLTNKTLTSPTINTPTITTLTATALALTDSSIIFEGSTADDFETTLTVVDPTADRVITIPNESGTLITSTSAATVSFSTAIAAALG
jgi:hypothetical protein|tara:strand:- start:1628 stop:2548 length:921 start_codon:yes stop_codon:yes gene_type:complete